MGNKLVLYFSVYGTARRTAEEIARQTGAKLQEIIPKKPYDPDRGHYEALERKTKIEHDRNLRPAMKGTVDIEGYDVVFVGYPIWWYTFPMIIYTLFDELDFSGKVIVPFNTHMGSGDGGTYRTIKELEPRATVLEGLPIEMASAEKGDPEGIRSWLERIGQLS
ncbi:MAG: flavodoxin [Coriobacteriales bacterium]|jgi:flavodoxin